MFELGAQSDLVVTLLGALAFEWLIGEPPNALHPVVWMGTLIGLCKRWGLRMANPRAQFAFGLGMAVFIPCGAAALAALVLNAVQPIQALQIVVGAWLLKATFAIRGLGKAARDVRNPLLSGDLAAAQQALRSLCSRDPSRLDGEQLANATIASVAENLSDSVIAPLVFFVVFGVPGAVFYRAVNTLDAMVGYRGRYEWLGKASARLDDLANLIPARLTALLLLAAAGLRGKSVNQGLEALRRDRRHTPSPNGGWPMATMAGLLGIAIEKTGVYKLGIPQRPASPALIDEAWRLAFTATLMTLPLVFATLEVCHGGR